MAKKDKVVSGVDLLQYTGNKSIPVMQAYVADGYETVMYWLPRGTCNNPDLELDEEFESLTNNPGIYILVGNSKSGISMYIGKADMRHDGKALFKRIVEHTAKNDSHVDWGYAVAFSNKCCGNKWDAAVTKSIEAALINELKNKCNALYIIDDNGKVITTTVYEENRKKETIDKIDINRVTARTNAIKVLLTNSNMQITLPIEEPEVNISKAVAMNFVIQSKAVSNAKSMVASQQHLQAEHNKIIDAAHSIIKEEKDGYAAYLAKLIELDIKKYTNGQIKTKNGVFEMPVPVKTVSEMIDKIPDKVFKADVRFLDIASTSGEFLIRILDKMMSNENLPIAKQIPDKVERLRHIVRNCLFGLTTSNVALQLNKINFATKIDEYKSLLGGEAQNLFIYPNIRYITDGTEESRMYIDLVKEGLYDKEGNPTRLYNVVMSIFGFKTGDEMKFDVVIGNPPYNDGMDIDFVKLGYDLCDQYCSMIIPAKWQTADADQRIASNMSYGTFRDKLVPHMKNVSYFPDCYDLFDIKTIDGITHFLLDKKNTYETATVTNNCKVQPILNGSEDRSIKDGATLWNIGAEILKALGKYERFYIPYQTLGRFWVSINTQASPGGGGFATKELNDAGKYVTKAGVVGNGGMLLSPNKKNIPVIGKIQLIDSSRPQEILDMSGTCTVVYRSDSIDECRSFISFMQTKLVRFLILINLSKLTIIDNHTFRYVPNPPSGKFDHIYTDKELYQHFGLSEEYVNIIESLIRDPKDIK